MTLRRRAMSESNGHRFPPALDALPPPHPQPVYWPQTATLRVLLSACWAVAARYKGSCTHLFLMPPPAAGYWPQNRAALSVAGMVDKILSLTRGRRACCAVTAAVDGDVMMQGLDWRVSPLISHPGCRLTEIYLAGSWPGGTSPTAALMPSIMLVLRVLPCWPVSLALTWRAARLEVQTDQQT